jgi:hypothetical protein
VLSKPGPEVKRTRSLFAVPLHAPTASTKNAKKKKNTKKRITLRD